MLGFQRVDYTSAFWALICSNYSGLVFLFLFLFFGLFQQLHYCLQMAWSTASTPTAVNSWAAAPTLCVTARPTHWSSCSRACRPLLPHPPAHTLRASTSAYASSLVKQPHTRSLETCPLIPGMCLFTLRAAGLCVHANSFALFAFCVCPWVMCGMLKDMSCS